MSEICAILPKTSLMSHLSIPRREAMTQTVTAAQYQESESTGYHPKLLMLFRRSRLSFSERVSMLSDSAFFEYRSALYPESLNILLPPS